MCQTRTDCHRPSVINPSEYDYVGFEPMFEGNSSFADIHFVRECRRIVREHMQRTGGTWSRHAHGGSCHVCGAYANNLAVWHHVPTNTYIYTGLTCAEHMGGLDRSAFDRMCRQARTAREYATGIAKRNTLLADNGLTHAMDSSNSIVKDMIDRLTRYGSLSERQWDFMRKLLEQDAQRAVRQAEIAAEREAAAEIPDSLFSGRHTVQMEVVSVKAPRDDDQFQQWKLVLKHKDGWMLYGTRPSALVDAERGDVVEFTAKFTMSNDDFKFGFYKRPTKASIVSKAEQTA